MKKVTLFVLGIAMGWLLYAQQDSTGLNNGKNKISAIEVNDIDDPVYSNLDANLDSLVHIWYVENSLDATREDLAVVDTLVPDFSDSVYIDRLSRIPTPVNLVYNRVVKNYIDVYTKKRRDKVEVMLGLADYYFPIFDNIFDYYGIPNEMKYMSIIESALNPRAYSKARAVGLWQFMYGTGKIYGLDVNSYVDERRDPIKSTHAACRFAKDLYDIYGDWLLVIAAYNCGPGNVNRAIRRSGGKKDFWEIYYRLPRETRGHVPAFIAATYVMNYYKEHNLRPASISLPVPSDTVMVQEELHLKQVAEVMKIPYDLLVDMNPQYRYKIIPGNHKPYPLRLPMTDASRFIDLQDSIMAYNDSVYFKSKTIEKKPTYTKYVPQAPGSNYTKLYYTVKAGDNLGYIAEWYDVGLSKLRYWNGIRRNMIRAGQKLVVYVPNSKASRYKNIDKLSFEEKQRRAGYVASNNSPNEHAQKASSIKGNYIYYTVRNGDTLWEIARQFPGVSDTDIMRLNDLTYNSKIHPGQKLKIKDKS